MPGFSYIIEIKEEVALKRKVLFFIFLTGQATLTVWAIILSTHIWKIHFILMGLFFYVASLIMSINFDLNHHATLNVVNRFINVSRSMRHEFRNHLQVLFSMIQLKKYQDALKYIQDVVNSDNTINHIFSNLSDPLLICCLLEIIYSFRQKDIDITVEVLGAPRLPQLWIVKRKMGKYISQFNKIQGKKDVKIILKNSQVEVLSNALGQNIMP
jgi:hypothetical protein